MADEDDRGPEHRHGDVPELPGRRGAVDLCRLVEVARHRLQGGQEDQRVVAGPAPVDHRRDREPRRPAVLLPGDRVDADVAEQPVDQPEVAREQQREDDPDRGDRGDVGQQDAHPPQRPGAQPLVEQLGQHQRHEQLRDGGDHEDPDRVEHRVPEVVVAHQVPVVVESGPGVVAEQAPVVQRDPEGEQQREQAEDREDDEERRDEGVAGHLLAARSAAGSGAGT